MNYVVFESGSRAGFSAEMFFRIWKKRYPDNNAKLILTDIDSLFSELPTTHSNVKRQKDWQTIARLSLKNCRIFPGDEMTRQDNQVVRDFVKNDYYASVEQWFYDKSRVNTLLASVVGASCLIKIPKTFELNSVCVKPNTMSAGSRNIEFNDNVCVSEKIDIRHEYVVDVLERNGEFNIFAREVVLRQGYDKFIKLLDEKHKLTSAVRRFLKLVSYKIRATLFKGVFHIQVAEDASGEFYFIEASKRISGSSIVNVYNGFNPFDALENTTPFICADNPFSYNKWYRFEEMVSRLSLVL
jgi:hypothetical protein